MRYHFIVDADSLNAKRQMEEQLGFAEMYLGGMNAGEAILITKDCRNIEQYTYSHAEEASVAVVENDSAETILEALKPLICGEDIYLFSGELQNTQIAVRLGYRMDGCSMNGVHGMVSDSSGRILVKRMKYANHMEAVCEPAGFPVFLTLANGLDRVRLWDKPFQIKAETYTSSAAGHILSEERYPEQEDGGLEDSRFLLVGGRGVGGMKGMGVLNETAQALGAQVGVSRPAAMSAWAPMNQMIGVSGTLAQPEICIAAGVSGSAAFYAGIEKSKWITAVNRDERAAIMKKSDVAVVEDFEPFMEALKEIIISKG